MSASFMTNNCSMDNLEKEDIPVLLRQEIIGRLKAPMEKHFLLNGGFIGHNKKFTSSAARIEKGFTLF